MLKRYFWLAHLCLVTLAAVFGADIARSYIGAKLAAPVASEPTRTRRAPNRQTPASPADHQIIVTRNIFNANPPQNDKEPVPRPPLPPVSEPTPPTQLQLKLAGTVAGVGEQRYAIIEDLSQRGAQALYQLGDVIQNALIIDIRPECVVLDKGGQHESLCFQQDVDNAQEPLRQSAAPPPRADHEADILRVDNATWRLSRELILEQFSDFGSLSQQARVIPYVVAGQQQGLRLTRLKSGSMLQRIGLQNGDVLQKVNGLDIASPDEALQAFQQLRNQSTVRLELLRRNRSTTLTYEIR